MASQDFRVLGNRRFLRGCRGGFDKSDVVNDLIRKAREIEAIRTRLIQAEQSGFINQSGAEILTEIKDQARRDGEL